MLVWIPAVVAVWFAVGALVAVPFMTFGVSRVIDGARGSSVAFRLLMVPATALLWPLVLRRWMASRAGAPHA